MSGSFGIKESSWLPAWAEANGYPPDTVTTTNNVALERGIAQWVMRDLKERYPDRYPQPINEHPVNRQAFQLSDFDAFFRYLEGVGESIGQQPERLSASPPAPAAPPPRPAADTPSPRRAAPDPQSKAGKLLATNARAREHLLRKTGELNLLNIEIDKHTARILDIDQGTGQSAQDARRAEIKTLEARLEDLKQTLRDLRAADRKASAFDTKDLPQMRAELEYMQQDAELLGQIVSGERAAITRRHKQIVWIYGEIDQEQLPQVHETAETDRLLRELAAGHLVTMAGAATRLGVTVQQLRDGKRRWNDFPDPVDEHPNKVSGDLYEFEKVKAVAKAHALVYVDEQVSA